MEVTAVFKKVPEGYVAWVEEIPGAKTQASRLIKARQGLLEAIRLVLEANRALAEESAQEGEVVKEPISLAAL